MDSSRNSGNREQAVSVASFPRACVVNLGCRVNRVECDWMESALIEAGCVLVPEDQADLIAINTCAVTGEAQAKTRKAVRRAASMPRQPLVAVTGCVANLFPQELSAIAPNVHILPKEGLVPAALALWHSQCRGDLARFDTADSAGQPLALGRLKRGVKVQDGCDNRCAYCIVWKARGVPQSVDPVNVEHQVRSVLADGAKEVELTGINLGRYGFTSAEGAVLDLAGLLDRIAPLARKAGAIVRASSVEPPEVTPTLVETMARNADVICAHLHLPLQAGCSATLARMGRRYDVDGFAHSVALLRDALPQASITTDVIVGFPGETNGDFEESLAFCEAMGFSKMHVFRFSARPGTEAATLANQVPADISRERSERMRRLGERLRFADAVRRAGNIEPVLVERLLPNGLGWGTTASFHDVEVSSHGEDPLVPGLYRALLAAPTGQTAVLRAEI